jgi:O-antigen/teichoic acid export membrane protein
VKVDPEDRVARVDPEMSAPLAVDARGSPTSHSTLLAGGVWNTAARVIPQLYTLAILVVAAHYLGAAGLGRQSYIAFIELTVVMLVTGGLPTAVMRYVSESLGRHEPAAARSLIRWAWGVELVAGTLGGGALVIAALLGASPTGAWTLAGVAAALGVFHSVPSALLLGAQRWRAASIAGLVIGSIGTGATVVVLAAGGGITGMFAVEAVVGLVTLAWTTLLARRVALELSPRIERSPELRRKTIRYSLLGSVSVLLAFVVWRRSEFFFLKHYSTYTQIAVYSIPFSFVAALVWVFEAVVAVVTPVVATLHGAGAHERIRVGYGRVIRLFLLTSLPLAAVMMSIGPALLRMFGSQFSGVGTVTLIMLVTFPFVPLAKAASGLLHGLGLIRLVLISSVFAAGANILLDFLIIPGNGAVGAAIANGGAQIIAAVPALFYSIRATGAIDWQARFLARGACVSAVAGTITWGAVSSFDSGPASVAAGIVTALVAFAIAARLFRLVPPDDAEWLQGILGPRLHGLPAQMIGWWTPRIDRPALGSGRPS